MNFSFYIAKRYLFSKKSYNVINFISLITICGIAIATSAAVCALSVFNGFQRIISETFSSFDPELKITSLREKVFDPTSDIFIKVRKLPGIALVSETLEDNILIKYKERQFPVIIKGISSHFDKLIPLKNIIFNSKFQKTDKIHNFAILGIGVARILKIDTDFIIFYAPKRNNKIINFNDAFNKQSVYVNGIFMLNQPKYDDKYVIVPINFARQLLDYKIKVSALEIRLKNHINVSAIKKQIRQIIQDDYSVQDQYEQQQTAFNMICIEKWVTFLLLCFIFFIVSFNLIGSLTILIVDKQKDIHTLRALGADNKLVVDIFFWEGFSIAILGCFIGIILGVFICFWQKYFGCIRLGNNISFIANYYPVQIKIIDLILIFCTVLLISFLFIIYPVKYSINKYF